MVVEGADGFMLQEGEEFSLVAFEPLEEPSDVLVTMVVEAKNVLKAMVQSIFPLIVLYYLF